MGPIACPQTLVIHSQVVVKLILLCGALMWWTSSTKITYHQTTEANPASWNTLTTRRVRRSCSRESRGKHADQGFKNIPAVSNACRKRRLKSNISRDSRLFIPGRYGFLSGQGLLLPQDPPKSTLEIIFAVTCGTKTTRVFFAYYYRLVSKCSRTVVGLITSQNHWHSSRIEWASVTMTHAGSMRHDERLHQLLCFLPVECLLLHLVATLFSDQMGNQISTLSFDYFNSK